jgi:TMEM175 potassium channel family protein
MTEERETGRIEAFSDGVFAIAITLLVLDIKVPTVEAMAAGRGLPSGLMALWPNLLAFVISFGTIL